MAINWPKRYRKLTLLHSNDMHGDFLEENIDDKLVGGVSLLSGYVNKVREEEPNTVYCIAGDMFRGSIIDAEYQGISTIELMNVIAPDVVTLGNHEVDYGITHLLFLEKCAHFPIINANMHITTNGARLFSPCLVKEIDGMKILFIGILTEQVLDQTRIDGLVGTFVDIEEAAVEVGRICNTYNRTDIDFTVLLTHIGWEEDRKLAERLDPAWGVDVIIGGHSHTFIEKPDIVNDILIVQAGTGTDQIGRFDIVVDTKRNNVESWEWSYIPIDDKHCPRDPAVEALLHSYKAKTDEKYGRVVTRLSRKLTHPYRRQETELGNLLSDIMQESLGVDVMMFASGSIRCEEMGPVIMYSDLVVSVPYDDGIFMVTVNGKQFRHMVRYMCRDEVWEGVHCEFYQFSKGVEIEYNRATHDFDKFSFRGKEVEDDDLLTIGLQGYHYSNFGTFFDLPIEEAEKNDKVRAIATSYREILEEYLTENPLLSAQVEGRLSVR